MSAENDLIKHLRELALATRLKRLGESLQADVAKLYAERKIDFEPKWFTMLYALYNRPGMSIVELSDFLKLTHPAIIQFSQQMTRAGLLKITKDKNDARRKLLQLTATGRKTFEKIEPILGVIENANRKFLEETGADVLALIEKMEALLEEKDMYVRITESEKELNIHKPKKRQ
jgi:DNA-binding MarR family transcriptional regulator